MMQDAKAFWDAIRNQVARLCRQETANTLRAARYDVTTAPNGKVIGVTQPYGAQELKIPYAAEGASAPCNGEPAGRVGELNREPTLKLYNVTKSAGIPRTFLTNIQNRGCQVSGNTI